MNNKEEFINQLLIAFNNGTLMTPKHDPQNMPNLSFTSIRSVLSHQLASNLERFIKEGKFSVEEFENKDHPNTPEYWVITPNSDSQFSVPASGITATTTGVLTEAYDRLIAVSGHTQGLHMYGEKRTKIAKKIRRKKLIKKKKLK